MGCASSHPAEILDTPGNEPCSFVVKKPMLSSTYQVMTGDDSRKRWLQILNNSDWFAAHSEFELKTFNDETLVKVTVDETDVELKRDVDWEADSDDSDFSIDDLFDFDEIDDDMECKVKLKWKVKREAKFVDSDGNEFANLQVKVKGKSKAELKIEKQDDMPDREEMTSSTKVKKVFYKLTWQDQEMNFEFENGHWQDWDRKWSCNFFDVEYDAKWGVDEVKVETNGTCLGGDALAVGFAAGYFFHPSGYASQMDGKARSNARTFMRRFT